MTRYPVKKVVLPSDMKGLTNGKLPSSLLKAIGPYGKMHHLASDAWEALRARAKQDGIELVHVGDYRSYESQLAMFMDRYVKGDSGDPRRITRTFQGQRWMLKKGKAPSASPGTSNHGWGLAIDAALKVNGKVVSITSHPKGRTPHKSGVDWLMQHADTFGFSWEVESGSQAEAWHIRYYAGDNVPQAVRDYICGTAPTPPKPAETPVSEDHPAPPKVVVKKPFPGEIRLGSKNKRAVKEIQTRLGIKVDGDFGPKTEAAVRAFQKQNPSCGRPDGVVGPRTWKAMFG